MKVVFITTGSLEMNQKIFAKRLEELEIRKGTDSIHITVEFDENILKSVGNLKRFHFYFKK